MALKNSKLSRTRNGIPTVQPGDALHAPEPAGNIPEPAGNLPEQAAGTKSEHAHLHKSDLIDKSASTGEPTEGGFLENLQTVAGPKIEKAQSYLKLHGNELGILVCALLGLMLLAAVVASTFSVQFLNRGVQLTKKGQYAQALPELTNAIYLNPNAVVGLYHRAAVYEKLGDLNNALLDYDRAIKINGFYEDAYEHRAAVQMGLGNFKEAVSDYTRAIGLTSSPRASLFASRGEAYSMAGDVNAALADYNTAIASARKNATFLLARSVCYLNQGKLKDAIKDCTTAAELEPRNDQAYRKRGWCYNFLGKRQEALKDMNLAVAINPNGEKGYIYRGFCYSQDKLWDKAIADFDQAIDRLNTKDPRAFQGRGECYLALGDKRSAIRDLDKALELACVDRFSKSNVYSRLKRGDIDILFVANECAKACIDLGDYSNAAKQYSTAIKGNPQECSLYIKRAKCYIQAGNASAALKDCDQAISLKPKDADLYAARARCYERLGRPVGALHDFEKALNLNPKSYSTYMARGSFFFNRRDFEKARDDFREATHINPKSAEAKERLALAMSNLRRGGPQPRPIPIDNADVAETQAEKPITSTDLGYLLGTGYRKMKEGNVAAALDRLERAVKLYPNDARARRYLGYALLQAQQPLGAVEQFKQLGNLGGMTLDDKLGMADALAASGKSNDAIKSYNECMAAAPGNVKVYSQLARAYSSMGFSEKAAQVCRDGITHAKGAEELSELELLLKQVTSPGEGGAPVRLRVPTEKPPAPEGDISG
jgi:tetratricopeptide (TPR) repeat protein